MSGPIFSAQFSAQTLTASTAYDIFSLKCASGNWCRLVALYLSQHALAGDSNDAQIQYQIKSGQTTQGSGGSTPTPTTNPRETTTTVVTAHALDTTQASAGTIITLATDAFNDRAGLIFIPTPEMQDVYKWGGAAAATCLTVSVSATGSTKTYTTGFNGTIYWCENP